MMGRLKKNFGLIAALQIFLLGLWIVSYPLHFWLDSVSIKQNFEKNSVLSQHGCCSSCIEFKANDSQKQIILKFLNRTTCSLCDFAVQLGSVDMPLACIWQEMDSWCNLRSEALYGVFSEYRNAFYSRAPPSQIIV